MSLKNYSVLKGRPIHNRLGSSKTPHYQVQVSANGDMYRIAINVRSQDGSEVEFAVKSQFKHPITDLIAPLQEGRHPVASQPGAGAKGMHQTRQILSPQQGGMDIGQQ